MAATIRQEKASQFQSVFWCISRVQKFHFCSFKVDCHRFPVYLAIWKFLQNKIRHGIYYSMIDVLFSDIKVMSFLPNILLIHYLKNHPLFSFIMNTICDIIDRN